MAAQDAPCPLVTAVIPVYNHEQFVAKSISSILEQSYSNLELIIINDGSTDRSHDVIAEILAKNKRINRKCVYINRENRGVAATLNEALSISGGKYFSPLASDDIALPMKFEILVRALEQQPAAVAAFGNARFIDQNGDCICVDKTGCVVECDSRDSFDNLLAWTTDLRDFNRDIGVFGSYAGLLFTNYLPALSSMIRTDSLQAAGGWLEDNVLEDWEMWLKLSKNGRFVFVDEEVALYRMHGRNTVSTRQFEILQASRRLIERERQYCIDAGLKREWQAAMSHQYFLLLRSGYLNTKERLNVLRSADLLSFLRFLLESVRNTILRKVIPRRSERNVKFISR